MHGVADYPPYLLVVIGGIRFMPRPKIEHFPLAAMERAAAAAYFPAFEPADKNELVRSRNVKMLSIHFFLLKLYIFADSFSDRMAWKINVLMPDCLNYRFHQ